MAKKGRGGAALALVAVGSFVAGTLAIIGLQIFAPLSGKVALSFASPEYFTFMILAFVLISNLTGGDTVKSFVMLALGLWLSSIGICPLDNVARFTFGSNELMLGIEFVPMAVGLFGLAEIISIGIEKYVPPAVRGIRMRELYPNRGGNQALGRPHPARVRPGVLHRIAPRPIGRHCILCFLHP